MRLKPTKELECSNISAEELANRLFEHRKHYVQISLYGNKNRFGHVTKKEIANIALECGDCCCIITDVDIR